MEYIIVNSTDYLSCEFFSDSKIAMRVSPDSHYSFSLPLYFDLDFNGRLYRVSPYDSFFYSTYVLHILEVCK